MLCTICVRRSLLVLPLRVVGKPFCVDLGVLASLESNWVSTLYPISSEENRGLLVEQNTAKALVEVFFYTRKGLLEYVDLGGACRSLGQLVCGIVLQDLGDWVGVGQRNQLVVFRDIFPVIDKDSLQAVGQLDLNRGAGVKGILLGRVSKGLEKKTVTVK